MLWKAATFASVLVSAVLMFKYATMMDPDEAVMFCEAAKVGYKELPDNPITKAQWRRYCWWEKRDPTKPHTEADRREALEKLLKPLLSGSR